MLKMKKNINIPESELIELISSTVRTIQEQESREPNWEDPRQSGPFYNRTHFLKYYKDNIRDKMEEEIYGERYYKNIMTKQFPPGEEVPYMSEWGWQHGILWGSDPIQSIVKFYNNYTCMKCILGALKGKSPQQRKLTAREIENGTSGWVGSKHHPKVHYSLRGTATEFPEYEFDYAYGNIGSEIFLELIKGGYTTNTYKGVRNTPEWKKLKEWMFSYFTDGKKLTSGDPKPKAEELTWTLQTIIPMVLWCHSECKANFGWN